MEELPTTRSITVRIPSTKDVSPEVYYYPFIDPRVTPNFPFDRREVYFKVTFEMIQDGLPQKRL